MTSTLNATTVTRESWDFTTDHFSKLLQIIAIPFILSVSLEGFIEIYYGGNPSPYIKSASDTMYVVFEAMWGVRWLRYLLEPPRQNQYFMAPFRFGKHELRYALYGLALIMPVIIDDLVLALDMPAIIKYAAVLNIFLFFFIFLRFEFIFPAIAISHQTSFVVSWRKSKPYWGKMAISFIQSMVIIIPTIAVLSLIATTIFIITWAVGLVDVSSWVTQNGFNALFQRSPIILGLYLIVKETVWFLFQALTLTIIGNYYRDAAIKIVSKKA